MIIIIPILFLTNLTNCCLNNFIINRSPFLQNRLRSIYTPSFHSTPSSINLFIPRHYLRGEYSSGYRFMHKPKYVRWSSTTSSRFEIHLRMRSLAVVIASNSNIVGLRFRRIWTYDVQIYVRYSSIWKLRFQGIEWWPAWRGRSLVGNVDRDPWNYWVITLAT